MPSLCPDERAWPPVLKAGWLQQTFVHWPFRPADVQVLLPRGLLVDDYDGRAWVSFTPFLMAGLSARGREGAGGLRRRRLRPLVEAPCGPVRGEPARFACR